MFSNSSINFSKFLFERVYNLALVKGEADKARRVVRLLYEYFMEHGEDLPGEHALCDEPRPRVVVDYIAGMTDQYALRIADGLGLLNIIED